MEGEGEEAEGKMQELGKNRRESIEIRFGNPGRSER